MRGYSLNRAWVAKRKHCWYELIAMVVVVVVVMIVGGCWDLLDGLVVEVGWKQLAGERKDTKEVTFIDFRFEFLK